MQLSIHVFDHLKHFLMVWKRVYYNNPIQRLMQTTPYSVFLGKYNNDIPEINLD